MAFLIAQENPLAGQVCLGERAGVVQLFDSYGESPIFSKLEWDCLVSYQGRGGCLVRPAGVYPL